MLRPVVSMKENDDRLEVVQFHQSYSYVTSFKV